MPKRKRYGGATTLRTEPYQTRLQVSRNFARDRDLQDGRRFHHRNALTQWVRSNPQVSGVALTFATFQPVVPERTRAYWWRPLVQERNDIKTGQTAAYVRRIPIRLGYRLEYLQFDDKLTAQADLAVTEFELPVTQSDCHPSSDGDYYLMSTRECAQPYDLERFKSQQVVHTVTKQNFCYTCPRLHQYTWTLDSALVELAYDHPILFDGRRIGTLDSLLVENYMQQCIFPKMRQLVCTIWSQLPLDLADIVISFLPSRCVVSQTHGSVSSDDVTSPCEFSLLDRCRSFE